MFFSKLERNVSFSDPELLYERSQDGSRAASDLLFVNKHLVMFKINDGRWDVFSCVRSRWVTSVGGQHTHTHRHTHTHSEYKLQNTY